MAVSRHLLVTALLSTALSPAWASVDPAIHKLCLEAKDYAGCVRAMKGDTSNQVRTINSDGAAIAEGNQCPAGWAYIGSGNCSEVKCVYNTATGLGFDTGHDQRVAGKANWGCKGSFWYGAGVMRLEGAIRASINPDCPPGEPKVGFNSTCQTAPSDWQSPAVQAARVATELPKCDQKLHSYKCSFSAYLEANPSVKSWAIANPVMAQKERIRLGSVD